MPENRVSTTETFTVMAGVLVVAAVVVAAIMHFNRGTDVTAESAPVPPPAGITTGAGGIDR
jgi:hypothetical protein